MSKRLLLLAALGACVGADAHPLFSTPVKSSPLPRLMTPLTEAEAAEVAKLRAEGRPALERLLAQWDAMEDGADRDALAIKIDRVAAQRYATWSRMFWYTDLDAAKAEAKQANKPILSLRMLGRLDEDLSCANSRYFRIALYANKELSQFLRENFVLHWSSERAVPRITVDMGDGRKLERTITGNSVHYVLDADGRPIDALPGLYAPAVFRTELTSSLAAVAAARDKTGDAFDRWLAEWHRVKLAARNDQWAKIARVTVPPGDGFRTEALAQMTTVTKSGYEVPLYRVVDLGVNVGKLPDDAGAWAQVGIRLLPAITAQPVPPPRRAALYRGSQLRVRSAYVGQTGQTVRLDAAELGGVDVLDASSKQLLAKLAPLAWTELPKVATDQQLAAVIDRFERDILADTAVNEFNVRQQIHGFFVSRQARNFDQLNTHVYDVVFLTPKSDPWLGLAPSGITALPADGFVKN